MTNAGLASDDKTTSQISSQRTVHCFGDVVEFIRDLASPRNLPTGTTCVELEHISQGTGRLIGSAVLSSVSSQKRVFQRGDVLFGKLRPYLRKVALVEIDGICSSEIWVFRARPDFIISPYLFHLIQTDAFINNANISSGTKMPRADWSVVSNYHVLLPSIKEQKKIAEILTCWDKAIELVERLIEEKRTLKRSLAQRIFFSKHRPTTSEDSEWITVELRHLLEVSKDKEPISETRPLFSLTIEHGVTPKTDRYDREALVKDKVAKLYKMVKPMDIVFNPSNLRWGAIGLCREKTPVLVSPIYEVVRVKDPKTTSTEFLFQLLSSERQINFFATLTEGTLIERMAVKVDTFLDQTVCIPSRREDQDALAAILSLADREISSLGQLGSALKDQKRGLMQQLLQAKCE